MDKQIYECVRHMGERCIFQYEEHGEHANNISFISNSSYFYNLLQSSRISLEARRDKFKYNLASELDKRWLLNCIEASELVEYPKELINNSYSIF